MNKDKFIIDYGFGVSESCTLNRLH